MVRESTEAGAMEKPTNKYIKTHGTPGKKKLVAGKSVGDSGQVNFTAAEMRTRRREAAEERARRTG